MLKFDFSFQADISKATSKNRRKRETIKFSCDWPFTYIGKSEWLRDKKAEFKLLVESARRLGSVPTGIQSKFERRLTEYVSRLENAIKPFLAKAPRHWAVQHFEWFVRYQIRPRSEFREIARSLERKDKWAKAKVKTHKERDRIKTVRDGVSGVARQIGLALRETKPRPTGRQKGSKTRSQGAGRKIKLKSSLPREQAKGGMVQS